MKLHVTMNVPLEPNDEALKQSKVYYEGRLSLLQNGEDTDEEEDEDDDDDDEEEEMSDDSMKPKPKEDFILHYEQLCRGETNKVHLFGVLKKK